MGKTYDSYPSSISTRPYLRSEGKTKQSTVIKNIDQAISDMEKAITELKKVRGLGTELYITRLEKEIDKLTTLRRAVNLLT